MGRIAPLFLVSTEYLTGVVTLIACRLISPGFSHDCVYVFTTVASSMTLFTSQQLKDSPFWGKLNISDDKLEKPGAVLYVLVC